MDLPKSLIKGWFPYDRGSQIADRNKVCDRLRSSAIIWKHTSAVVCDPAIMIADDRRRSQKIEHKGWSPYDRESQIADRNKVCDRLRGWQDRRRSQKCFHMIADDRRPYCDLRSAICDLRSAIIWKPALMGLRARAFGAHSSAIK